MADAGFQPEHLVSKVVEVLANDLHQIDNDTENTLIQMANVTSQSTQILPQILQQMQQMKMLMAQMQTRLNNGGSANSTGGGNKVPFWI